jgi:outer membrane phospholipase A
MFSWVACFAADTETETGTADSVSATEAYEDLQDLFSLYQPYLGNLRPYKPIYFLLGADPEDSRFQISLKYQLFGDQCPLDKSCAWMKGIHLGYTQTSSWDLQSDSAPFEDTSYQPEIFFLSKNTSKRPDWMDGLFYQIGVLHESNGRAGDESRSTNYVYFTPSVFLYSPGTELGIYVAPKVVMFFNNSDDTNPDLDRYRGNFELEVKAGKAESLVLGSTFRFASRGISTQLDLTYPLSTGFLKNLQFYLHAQYVNTYAETLLDYKERTEAFRFGIAILR